MPELRIISYRRYIYFSEDYNLKEIFGGTNIYYHLGCASEHQYGHLVNPIGL